MLAHVLMITAAAVQGLALSTTRLAHNAGARAAVRMAAKKDPLVEQSEQCLESGCSVDDVSELLYRLNER